MLFLILGIVAITAYLVYSSMPYSSSRIVWTLGAAMITFLVAPMVVDQVSALFSNNTNTSDNVEVVTAD